MIVVPSISENKQIGSTSVVVMILLAYNMNYNGPKIESY